MCDYKYKNIVIKLSGESICGISSCMDVGKAIRVVEDIKSVLSLCENVCIVVGGGNIIRGRDFVQSGNVAGNVRQSTIDSIGMLSTIMNAAFLSEILKTSFDIESNIFTPHSVSYCSIGTYDYSKYLDHKTKVSFFAGGTGLPYFSTDMITVICAQFTEADIVLKATKTDGIYDRDPFKYANALHIPQITYDQIVRQNLHIMDQAAFIMARDFQIKIRIFCMEEKNCFVRALRSDLKCSTVC